MLKYYVKKQTGISVADEFTPGCWIALTAPDETELKTVSERFSVEPDALRAALDADERSRIDYDDNFKMILVNVPTIRENSEKELYDTIPLSVILVKDAVITVCGEESPILRGLVDGKVKDFNPALKSRFVLQILYRTASLFLQYLRIIDKRSDEVENKLHKSTKNHELIELLKLEKSLVYFTTALSSNEAVLEKLLRGEFIRKYPDDAELLEDVIVENKQAIEMANIYSGILSGMMDAFASVISNNLNIVMKVLAIITIVMSIPTMIFSLYGMNVAGLPLAESPWCLPVIIVSSAVLSVAAAVVLVKLKLFK